MPYKSKRLIPLILLTAALFAGVLLLSPQQLPVLNAKLLHITLGGVIAFWMDVLFFPYARPDYYLINPDYRSARPRENDADVPVVMGYRLLMAAAMLRRAVIVGCAMLAVALGM
ncbi:MAG: hypothetical protein GC139_10460 [Sideroxydans sp.]|nr:hypothetical protein [Sideroxydans sp.]